MVTAFQELIHGYTPLLTTIHMAKGCGSLWWKSGACLYIKTVFHGMGISTIKMRRSSDPLIFIMGIPILVRRHLYIETAPGRVPTSICCIFFLSELMIHFYCQISNRCWCNFAVMTSVNVNVIWRIYQLQNYEYPSCKKSSGGLTQMTEEFTFAFGICHGFLAHTNELG